MVKDNSWISDENATIVGADRLCDNGESNVVDNITTYSVILGFVIGSLLYLYPGISFDLNGLICFIILSISTILSYMITN